MGKFEAYEKNEPKRAELRKKIAEEGAGAGVKWSQISASAMAGNAEAAAACEALQASADFNAQSKLGQEITEQTKEVSVSMDENIRVYSRILNLLLYLCAEEPDYDKSETGGHAERRTPAARGFCDDGWRSHRRGYSQGLC